MIASAFFLVVAAGASYLALSVIKRAFGWLLIFLKWIIRCIVIGIVIGMITNHEAVIGSVQWLVEGIRYSLQ